MGRLTLLLLALCFCFAVAAPTAFAQSGDRDSDGVKDADDACPDASGWDRYDNAASNGCPDTDGDRVADRDDACPDAKVYPSGAGNGCPDTDSDGLTDDKDACPTEGKDPGFPKRKPGADGCYPTYVYVVYGAYAIKWMAWDSAGIVKAHCKFNRGQKCVVYMTMTLSAKSAKALGLKNRRIADLKIPLTTEAEKEAAYPREPKCLCRARPQGKLDLGLSAALRKRIAKLASLTMTMRATYALGSAKPVSLGERTIKLSRKPPNTSSGNVLENIPGFGDDFATGTPWDPEGVRD